MKEPIIPTPKNRANSVEIKLWETLNATTPKMKEPRMFTEIVAIGKESYVIHELTA